MAAVRFLAAFCLIAIAFHLAADQPEDIEKLNEYLRLKGLLRDAFFASNSDTLDRGAREALKATAAFLREHPEYGVVIEGHCDPRGTVSYNRALGSRRAEAAKAFLATAGVSSDRMRPVSYGEERPFEDASMNQNRRAHLVIVRLRR